jgi:hypothetical protein
VRTLAKEARLQEQGSSSLERLAPNEKGEFVFKTKRGKRYSISFQEE